jgi:Putative rhamnosyl transferase
VFDHRPIYGHIRFSFYGITDTRLKPDTDGTALARLYDETRMARRFFLFENLTLPSLLHQTDRDFRTVIMSSSLMPDRFKDRLSTLAARLPGAVVDFSEYQRGDKAFYKFMAQAAGVKGRESSVHFRLDDDDALAISYIQRLRDITRVLSPSTHVTFPTGILLFPQAEANPVGTSILNQQLLTAQGLATVNGGTFHKNPFQMMHGTVWTRWPVVSDPRTVAYIRVHHFDNDTIARQDRVIAAVQRERASRRAARHAANVDLALAKSFPWIDRTMLDGLIARCQAVKSLSDLPPVS